MLRWNAYFKEAVTESAAENHRVRKCVIYMYLEDESVYVGEPRQPNSGIPQGTFLKRHKIPKDDKGGTFGVGDIEVGSTVTFYGRTFFVTSCDAFTREYLTSMGKPPAEEVPMPDEPIDAYRATLKKDTQLNPYPPAPRDDALAAYIEAAAGAPSNALVADKLKKFLANDRKVLRFFCLWDDRAALYGERRPFVLHYYLADDSVEVLEVSEPNSGRDPFPVFLRRQPLPNKKLEVDALGPTKSYTYYTYKDLRVGNTVNVYGREFLIHDADNFTKAWYIQNEGYSEADFPPVDVEEEELPIPQNAVPPYNGFGGLADSLQNCVALIPKPVRPNFDKQMNYTNTILRFRAKMQDDDEHVYSDVDKDRDFIISVYLANDTISVFEPPDRAKNVIGGKFLERQECLKPGTAERYEATDCYAGAVLTLFSRKFLLTEADGYSYGFMEAHGPSFPRSDFAQVMARFRALGQGREEEVRRAFLDADLDGSGRVNRAELERALQDCDISFVAQEVITVIRKLDERGDGRVPVEAFFEAFGAPFFE